VVPEQVVKRGWREDPPTEDFPLTVAPTIGTSLHTSGPPALESSFDNSKGIDPELVVDVELAAAAGSRPAEPEDSDDNRVTPHPTAERPEGVVPVMTAMAPPQRRGWWRILVAVGMLVALGLVAWLAVTEDDVDAPSPTLTAAPEQAAALAPVAFGEQVRRPDGWTVQISEPAAVRPEDNIDLPTGVDRAVQFEITLTNDAGQPRDSAGWILKATADSHPVDLLPSHTATAPSRTILSGESLRFTVAVPMPAQENVDLLVEAEPAGSSPALFVGQA